MENERKIEAYRAILLRWSERINLIGPEARRNLDDHIAEALEAARILEPEGAVLDFGSGGGLPAIPMAIASPHATFYLCEADQKKWSFLKRAVRECALNSIVLGDRLHRALETLDPRVRFRLVTSRAVGRPGEWVPVVADRLDAGGRIALFERDPELPPIPGFVVAATHRLPRGEDNHLVILERRV
jgi:16S rRNA (guanine527-N7)-methyltransferase